MNQMRSWIGRIIFAFFLANLLRICQSNDDFTRIWYYGCRWIGGSSMKLTCNCTSEAEELYLYRGAINSPNIETIEINGCPKVRFGSHSISDLRSLRNIKVNSEHHSSTIVFEQNSINWYGYRDHNSDRNERFDLSTPSLKVTVKNANVKTIASQVFAGRINEINFENVIIDNIETFAFTNLLLMEKLQIRNSLIIDLKSQSFKKFGTEYLALDNVTIKEIPSRAFSDITTYRKFLITNCRFGTLRPSALIILSPSNFIATYNQIKLLDGEAFFMMVGGDVLFKHNIFHTINNEAFYAIKLLNNQEDFRVSGASHSASTASVVIDSNTVSVMEKYSFQMQDNLDKKILNLNLNQTCNCESIVNNFENAMFYNEIQCLIDSNEYINARKFKTDYCSILTGHYTTIIIVSVLIALLGIITICSYIYYKMVYRSQKYGCNKDRKSPFSLIVPDGRTYRETELHVIVEKADLLTTDL